jgi:hypothetical protein
MVSAPASAGTRAAAARREVIKRMVVCSVREPAQRVFFFEIAIRKTSCSTAKAGVLHSLGLKYSAKQV